MIERRTCYALRRALFEDEIEFLEKVLDQEADDAEMKGDEARLSICFNLQDAIIKAKENE